MANNFIKKIQYNFLDVGVGQFKIQMMMVGLFVFLLPACLWYSRVEVG